MLLSRCHWIYPSFITRNFLRYTASISTCSNPPPPPPCEEDELKLCDEDVLIIKDKKEDALKEKTTSGDGNDDNTPKLITRPEFPGKVRLGFIPEEWFQFFYPKTGVTGPYAFGVGFLTYLCSKEIYVMEHEYYTGLSLALMIIYCVKRLGRPLAHYTDELLDRNEAKWEEMHKNDIDIIEKEILAEKNEQWRADGAVLLCKAKKEQIDMQIEAAYREKALQVHEEVVNLLNYQVDCRNVERRVAHKNMVFWVQEQILKELGPEENPDVMEKRKADLSALVMRVNDMEATIRQVEN